MTGFEPLTLADVSARAREAADAARDSKVSDIVSQEREYAYFLGAAYHLLVTLRNPGARRAYADACQHSAWILDSGDIQFADYALIKKAAWEHALGWIAAGKPPRHGHVPPEPEDSSS